MALGSIMYAHLLLLGFDPVAEERRHRVRFAPDMFSTRHSPAAVHAVLHFLLDAIDSQATAKVGRACMCSTIRLRDCLLMMDEGRVLIVGGGAFGQDFVGCWPVVDKRGEAEFRRAVAAAVARLQQEPDVAALLPRFVPSLLVQPVGDRCVQQDDMQCASSRIACRGR
jgi:hypothetical protein